MVAHNSIQTHPEISAGDESRKEQARLDDAIRRADELLVSSLKVDEHRRSRHKVIFVAAGLLIGGLLLAITVLGVVVLAPLVLSHAPEVREQVALAGTSKASKPDQERSAQISSEAWKLWQQQSFDEAITKFDEAVKLDPKNTGAWNGLGWANFNGGRQAKAEKAFKKVIALEPKHPAALNGLGQIALSQRKYDQAEGYLLKASPQATAAWFGLARVYLLTGKYDQAAKWAQKLIATGETNETTEEILKAAKAKKVSPALREQLEPNPAMLEVSRAWQLANQGRQDEAKAIYNALLAKDPKDANALNGMGWCLFGAGDIDAAKPYFERAIAADPKAAGSLNGLARILSAKGDTDGAIKIWKQMVETIPGVHAGTAGLAEAYLEKEEYQKALPLLEQWAKAEPQNEEIQNKLKLARAKLKNPAKESGK